MSETHSRLLDAPTVPLVARPRRATLVVMAVALLVVYVAMLATGSDVSYDASLSDIVHSYDQSRGAMQLAAYVGMVFVGLLLFFGAALRNALRVSAESWLADVTLLGFVALAATLGSWIVTDVAMWKAVDYGDESAIRTIAVISDAGFLPLMASMIAVYLGTGLAGLLTGALPRWLAIASIAIGILAPLGPLGFVGATLLPIWLVATAVTVRLTPTP
ncbi:MAG: hypothetical protein LH616_13740 [Ilumatobacteraceae bacterium]|nr:hypothetical protein [Ilumatobacteraceae bacterium]